MFPYSTNLKYTHSHGFRRIQKHLFAQVFILSAQGSTPFFTAESFSQNSKKSPSFLRPKGLNLITVSQGKVNKIRHEYNSTPSPLHLAAWNLWLLSAIEPWCFLELISRNYSFFISLFTWVQFYVKNHFTVQSVLIYCKRFHYINLSS